jgi:hypothetical protein
MGAIPKFAPVLVVDGVIREMKRAEFTDRETGVVSDRGRSVIMLTSQGFTEISVSQEDNRVEVPDLGERWIAFVELSEWNMQGRSGTKLTYVAPVSPAHLEDMLKYVGGSVTVQTPATANK